MFESLRKSFGIRYASVYFRKKKDQEIRFTESVSRSRRALVIFPETVIDWESTQAVLRYLSRRFSSGSMQLLVRSDFVASIPSIQSLKTITYAPEDVNAWYVPRKRLLRKIKSSTFDVALDLNIQLALPSAFLCRESDAPLRISFAKLKGDSFYNFQVQTNTGSTNPMAYRNFIKCLDMF